MPDHEEIEVFINEQLDKNDIQNSENCENNLKETPVKS